MIKLSAMFSILVFAIVSIAGCGGSISPASRSELEAYYGSCQSMGGIDRPPSCDI